MTHNTNFNVEWQKDWSAFVDVLANHIRQGCSQQQLATQFGSKDVAWSGVLIDKSLDEIAPMVTVRMPIADLDLGRDIADVRDQSVPCARDSVSIWSAIPLGTPILFTATFRSPAAVFPPVEVNRLASGRVVVLIGITDGRPLMDKE